MFLGRVSVLRFTTSVKKNTNYRLYVSQISLILTKFIINNISICTHARFTIEIFLIINLMILTLYCKFQYNFIKLWLNF